MTIRELSNLRKLNTEIAVLQQKAVTLETLIQKQLKEDGTSLDAETEKAYQKALELHRRMIRRRTREWLRLEAFINELPDSYSRRIFTLRYVEALSWRQVAMRLGGAVSENALNHYHRRALERYNRSHSEDL